MITLCGFAASNYYNKVKLALLEKDVPFSEELAWVGETDLAASPLGKVPYLKTDEGALCESTVMLEYIEAKYPQPALLPADPFAAAKVRELLRYLELHLELVARNLYPEAFFGGKVSDSAKEKTAQQLEKTSLPLRSWPSSRHTWPVTTSPWRTAPPSSTCHWSREPPRSSMAATSWPICRCATISRRSGSGPAWSRSMPTARPTPIC